jgi:hypothetical protein
LECRLILAADLAAWWQAESLTLSDGEIVEIWSDNVTGVQARAGEQPRYAARQMAGRDAVRFEAADGADSFRVDQRSSPMGGINDFSIVAVFATSASNLQGDSGPWFENTALIDASTLGLGQDWGMSLNSSGQVAAGMGGGFGSAPVTLYSQASGLNDGQPHIVSIVRQGTKLSVRVDDFLPVERQDASSAARSHEIDVTFGVGQAGGRAFSGDMGQIRVYRGALAEDERDQVHAELKAFYHNVAPIARNDQYTIAEDVTLSIPSGSGLFANDQHTDIGSLQVSLVTPPSHGVLTLNNDGSFDYAPDRDYFGADSFTYRAVDVLESNVATVLLEVQPVYDTAVPVADHYRLLPNQLLSFDAAGGLLANDVNPDGGPLTVALFGNPPQGELHLSNDGSFTYHSRGFTGSTSFSYRVDDGTNLSQPATVTLNVNAPPRAAIDRYSTTEDVSLHIGASNGVLANDRDDDNDPLVTRLVTPPSRGKLVLNPDGSFVYEPDADAFGADLFAYQAFDGLAASETVLVQISVDPVNDAPVVVADSYFTVPDQLLSIDVRQGVLSNDRDVDGPVVTASIVDLPANGELQLADDGSFQYRPKAGFTGEDRFRYQATDSVATSEIAVVSIRVTTNPIVISEFMTRNADTLPTRIRATANASFRGASEFHDWIEIHNLLGQPVDLGGMFLTDSRRNLTKWSFPSPTEIPANGYLIVYASGLDISDPQRDERGRLHTNFKLDGEGEYLALTAGADAVVWDYPNSYPPQKPNVSFGVNDQLSPVYFATPTPAAENGKGRLGWVEEVEASVQRGFFDQPFMLRLATPTPASVIRYTLDGTAPTATNGAVYSEPLSIDATTTLRAAAFRDDWLDSNVVTHTYLFLDSVIRQPADPAGYPAQWKRHTADYGMSQIEADLPLIAGDPSLSVDAARDVIKQSLLALPTMSIVLPAADLFDSSRGIYANPAGRGDAWERPASVEYLLPDGTPGFHINAGLRIIGFTSRDLAVTPKLGFRLLFRSEYGQGQLEYPLFGDSSVDSFDTLMLRGNARDTWITSSLPAGPRDQSLYMRDQWAKAAQAAMGQPATAGRFVHLYLNGMYWGIYNPTERPDAAFAAEHFGGDESDYDVISFCCPHEVNDGDMDEWLDLLARARAGLEDNAAYQLIQGNRPDGTRDPNLPVLIDIDNFIDFVIHGQYHASVDWPGNYYVIRSRSADSTGFKFLTWDNDLAFPNLNSSSNKVRTDPGHPWWVTSPGAIDIALRENPEYRVRFADRAHRHLFHDGALTPEAAARLWSQIADGLEQAMIAESARWGDYRRDVSPSGQRTLYTPQEHWRPTVDRMLRNYFPRRTENLLRQLRSAGLYPDTDSPEFLIDGTAQYGGPVRAGSQLSMSAASGLIYYTLDGTDPRLPGGAISPAAIPYSDPLRVTSTTVVKARVLNGQEWSALSDAAFVIGGVIGDFNSDSRVDVADIDLLCARIQGGNGESSFDLTRDGRLDDADLTEMIRNVLRTDFGDANLDKVFNSQDLVSIFQAGEYEDLVANNSTWSEGDWDCDGEFGSSDLVRAFQSGAYVAGVRPQQLLPIGKRW